MNKQKYLPLLWLLLLLAVACRPSVNLGPGDARGERPVLSERATRANNPTPTLEPTATVAQETATVQPATATASPSPSPPPTPPPTLPPMPLPPTQPSVPVILDPGAPPSKACVALAPTNNPMPDVYLGPGTQFALAARLGNWAEVLQSEGGWHMLLVAPGQTGWVAANAVILQGPCQDAPPDLPFLETVTETLVYSGPAKTYDPVHTLPPGQRAHIRGRSADGLWWAIHGPGDGPGSEAWVAASTVIVHGDGSLVPVLAAPD